MFDRHPELRRVAVDAASPQFLLGCRGRIDNYRGSLPETGFESIRMRSAGHPGAPLITAQKAAEVI